MELKFRPAVSKMSMLPCHIHVITEDELKSIKGLPPNFNPRLVLAGSFFVKFDHEYTSLAMPDGQLYPAHMLQEFEFIDEEAPHVMDHGEFKPSRWWRVLDSGRNLWRETSVEREAREAMQDGFKLQRLYERRVTYYEWRDQA